MVTESNKSGRLVGSFLQASDLKDILELRQPRSPSPSPYLSPSLSQRNATQFRGDGDGDAAACDQAGTVNIAAESYAIRRPCWYPFATEGLRLQLQTQDEHGGKLSLRGDDELLRRQK